MIWVGDRVAPEKQDIQTCLHQSSLSGLQPLEVEMKTCSKCHQLKDESEYYPHSKRPGKFTSECKECARLRAREKRRLNPEHSVWIGMKRRCSDPKDTAWRLYGAKGVSVCERWMSFDSFFADVGKRPSNKHSIDRIDSSGNYEPGNCRWATITEQNRHREGVFLTKEDATKIKRLAKLECLTHSAIAKMFGCSGALVSAIKRGTVWKDVA